MENTVKYPVFFIGIGGIGMSALARYFRHQGHPVAGYDGTETALTQQLEQEGCKVYYEDEVDCITTDFCDKENTLVVYTPAIPNTSRLFQFFKQGGFKLEKRAKVLGDITKHSKCLAIAGTHGKTTTTCILTHLMYTANAPFTAFLGGVSEDLNSNYVYLGDVWCVVEADEFDRSFLHLNPTFAAITATDADHLDIYGTTEAFLDSFQLFANKLSPNHLLVRQGLTIKGVTYGVASDAAFHATNIRIVAQGYLFDLVTPFGLFEQLIFSKPGLHNLSNAIAALALFLKAGFKITPEIRSALASFKGVARRFSVRINKPNLVVIDDYAHHPEEIKAMFQAVKERYPSKHLTVIFQPHLYSRTKDFGAEFATVLALFDRILLIEIYPAREQPLPGINSHWLLDQIHHSDKALVDRDQLIPTLIKSTKEVILVLGAGDISLEAIKIEKHFAHAS